MWKRLLSLTVCCVMLIQLAACGVILYPERKGQKGGRIDPGVAVLDAIGLLFFIIPGVVAFAVDFGTGAIYMPGTANAAAPGHNEMHVVRVDPADLDEARIEAEIEAATGKQVDLAAAGVVLRELRSAEDLSSAFAAN